jgi:hypothetical protein
MAGANSASASAASAAKSTVASAASFAYIHAWRHRVYAQGGGVGLA